MVVLRQHDRIFAVRFRCHGIGKSLVDRLVLPPVAGTEDRPHVGDVAERPEPFIGKAVVITVFFLFCEPDAPQRVLRMFGRDSDPVVRVHGFPVRAAAAVRDPGSRAGPHDRFDGSNQSARRSGNLDPFPGFDMDIGFAIGNDEDSFPGELFVKKPSQRVGVPDDGDVFRKPAFRVQGPKQVSQVSREGLQFGGGRLHGKRFQDSFAAQHGPDAGHPSPPAQVRDEYRDQGDDDPEHRKEDDDVFAGGGAPALDVAHVMQNHQRTDPHPLPVVGIVDGIV